MHDNHETQKINQTSVMPEKTGVYWNSRFSIAPMRGWAHSTKAVVINNAWRRLRQ
ncbi:tRNA-dihydrouridine synthase A [Escherichia albertii KF1]|nr:tRNA-dihydrouridine synthase A [Escherichia albertii KF1]